MSHKRVTCWFRLIVVLLFSFGIAQSATAQSNQPPDDKETLQALLIEVRSLRVALQTLQRMNIDTYRSQILVDRVRVNREDVRRLTTSLNETRDLLAKTQATIPQFIDRQKMLETQVQLEIDQNKRAQLEFEAKRTKDGVEMYKAQVEPLKEREQQLSAELNSEKAKLAELENRLDSLERAMERDREKLESNNAEQARKP